MAKSPNNKSSIGEVIQLGVKPKTIIPPMPTIEDILKAAGDIAYTESTVSEEPKDSGKPAARISSLSSLVSKKSPFSIIKEDEKMNEELNEDSVIRLGSSKPPPRKK